MTETRPIPIALPLPLTLAAFPRGAPPASSYNNGVLDTVTTASATNSWNLDALGNWTSTGTQSRTFNAQNQIASISGKTTPTYDNNGNMTKDEAGNTYSFDAWNRMISMDAAGTSFPAETYSYDADSRRPGLNICAGAIVNSYYDSTWQDVEDDAYTPPNGCNPASTTVSTYDWSASYIDDIVARDQSTNGGAVTRIYAQQDANHDVTALLSSGGSVLQRYVYDPYGTAKVLGGGWNASSDAYSWVYTFQGGRYDPTSGKINFRNRDLDTVTGTWMEKDPAGYGDGADLYQLEDSNTENGLDPTGLGPMRTYATRPGPWRDVIDGPLEALDNFQSRKGGTARLSDALIDALKHYDFYQNILSQIRKQANTVPCDGEAHSFTGGNQYVLTSPIQPAEGGLAIQQIPGFDPAHPPRFAKEPNYSFLLNTTLGTIHSLTWEATSISIEESRRMLQGFESQGRLPSSQEILVRGRRQCTDSMDHARYTVPY